MSHPHADPQVSGRRLFWTIVLNSIITAAEFVAGLISGYLALMADAVHNLSDVAALILAWLGVKGSQIAPTKRSTYGYKRVEVMTAFISASALVVIAVFIIYEAYQRYIDPQPLTHPGLFLTVAVIGLFGNLASVWLLQRDRGRSLNMKTAFLHMAYDALSSVVVIAGGIVILYTGWVIVDTILSVAIALMIFWSSYLVIKEAVLILLEAVPPAIDFDIVHGAINEVDEVLGVHDLHIWSLSSYEIAMSCHVVLSQDDFARGPQVVACIDRLMREEFEIGHSTIQIERDRCAREEAACNFDAGKEGGQ